MLDDVACKAGTTEFSKDDSASLPRITGRYVAIKIDGWNPLNSNLVTQLKYDPARFEVVGVQDQHPQ